MLKRASDLSECSAGFELTETTSNCTACTGDTYKSDIADTACEVLPSGATVPADLIIDGGNTGFSEWRTALVVLFQAMNFQ